MLIRTTNYFNTAEKASEYINSLPNDTRITLGIDTRTNYRTGENEIVWKIITETKTTTVSQLHMETLHNIITESVEEQDAINYGISAIKTLIDMGVIE